MAQRVTSRTLAGAAACAGVVLVLGFGCAPQRQLTRLSPGVYQVECKDSLAACLVTVQDVCRPHGYDVLSASEKRNNIEQEFQGYGTVNATARVRCRQAVPMFGPDPNVPVPTASASVSAVPSSPPAPSVVPAPAPVPAAASAAPPSPPVVPATPPAPAASVDAGAP